jgi:hypothetical protein
MVANLWLVGRVYYFTTKSLYLDIQEFIWNLELRYYAYCVKEVK